MNRRVRMVRQAHHERGSTSSPRATPVSRSSWACRPSSALRATAVRR